MDTNNSVSPDTSVVVTSNDPGAVFAAQHFVDTLAHSGAFKLHVSIATKPPSNAIVFQLDPDAAVGNPEGYALDTDPGSIVVRARAAAGLFYGGVTLWQLLTPGVLKPADYEKSVPVPAMHIEDWPHFRWRGLMLDSARHFQSVADIEKLVDSMSLHKLNVLHWHLTDDQGWRLEIPKYPELTKTGACRKAIGPDVALTGGPDKPYCGYYTDAEVREIVRYAAERFVTIVPEIDIPGHAQAAIAAYPWLGVTGERPPVSTDWGVNTWLLRPDARSLKFVEDVMDEVMALFPSKYIHIGGDEAAKDQWQTSPEVRAHMQRLGLKDMDALQGWFTSQVAEYLVKHGRTAVGWDEILQGGLQENAIVMSWRGAQGAIEAAKLGHDTVMSPSPALYFDHLQSDLPDEPTGRPDMVSLQSVYAFEPVPKELDAQQARHVIGAQANLWSEYLTTFARVEHAAFPRVAALSEALWSPRQSRDWQGFLARMPAQLARYRKLGVSYADGAFAVQINARTDGAHTRRVTLSNQTGFGTIRYTLDGSEPNGHSQAYSTPFDVTMPVTIHANVFVGGMALAAARARELDAQLLLRLASDRLKLCTNAVPLRLEDGAGEAGVRFNIDILDPCWIYPKLDLSGIRRITVRVGTVPNNFNLWHDAAKIVTRPAHSPVGELELHSDTCNGPLLSSLPMAEVRRGELATVSANVSAQGTHDVCLFFTGRSPEFLRAIDWIGPVVPR